MASSILLCRPGTCFGKSCRGQGDCQDMLTFVLQRDKQRLQLTQLSAYKLSLLGGGSQQVQALMQQLHLAA